DIVVTDDALGSNVLSLSGADATLFEIDGTELFVKAGTILDFEINPALDVTVEVDDTAIGSTPDHTAVFSLSLSDVFENYTSVNVELNGVTTDYELSSYDSNQDLYGQYSISETQDQVTLMGNTWKKLDIGNYTITANTILEFDFLSTVEGDFHAIGFDTDNDISQNSGTTFMISGQHNGWGLTTYDNYTTGSGWQSYAIPVGDYFTGSFTYLTLVNENEQFPTQSNGHFQNLKLYETDTLTIGTVGNDTLTSTNSMDFMAGGDGDDIFVFRLGDSILGAIDRISDFVISTDKITLLTQGGDALNTPGTLSRATDSATTDINTIVDNVFTDADGALIGNQGLGVNSAVLVKADTAIYMIVNDGNDGFQTANDLVINLTGIAGTFPALGALPTDLFFI
ncbi:MAG: hypothetical protein RLZZ490_398, partial [Cyanobacteriota bacterium]